MELQKQDKRHIDEQVKKLQMRMHCEATEYAKLCERYYYERIIEACQQSIDVLDAVHEHSINYANSPTN